eukprot:1506225-Amphidinium_carterae.1
MVIVTLAAGAIVNYEQLGIDLLPIVTQSKVVERRYRKRDSDPAGVGFEDGCATRTTSALSKAILDNDLLEEAVLQRQVHLARCLGKKR